MVVETDFERRIPVEAPRSEARDGYAARISQTPVTIAVIAANVLVYVLEHRWAGGDPLLTMVRMGALVPRHLDPSSYASTLAYAYLHFGALHLGVNMFALYNLGLLLEPVLGSARFYVLYTLSALGGGFLVLLFERREAVTAGASGAIFGLLGAVCVVFWQMRARTHSPARRKDLGNVVFKLLVPNVLISLLPGVSLLGHLGGLLVGGAYLGVGIYRLPRFRTPEQHGRELSRDPFYRAVAIVLALVTVAAIGFVWLVRTPWLPS